MYRTQVNSEKFDSFILRGASFNELSVVNGSLILNKKFHSNILTRIAHVSFLTQDLDAVSFCKTCAHSIKITFVNVVFFPPLICCEKYQTCLM